MRIKRHKRLKRAVKFYTTCCGFRKPFRVFCCGTFVHHLIDRRIIRIAPADHLLSDLLHSPVKLFTTKCIIAELKRLGRSYTEALDAARSLITATCNHEEIKGGDACIRDLIGRTNDDHFFLATTDKGLRKKFREVPNTPIIYASKNAVTLESPSAFQHSYVKKMEEKRSHMSLFEYKLLYKRRSDVQNPDDDPENKGTQDQQTLLNKKKNRNRLEIKDRVQFKRKIAKAPNPLSCLKKKKKPGNKNTIPKKKSEDGNVNNNPGKRKRNRKRRSKSNKNKQAYQSGDY
ncbi:rRNA-processing protein Fcf1/Utp [Trema orientale]|uniref:rRNA-processing protein Fcf1/Utp n=1 Tax=Trema orientale TaxID=63057 RepID=A0A2P5FYR8_TREOI|nr:rRNA-processing protein Fcf1/Utp [Trema orientale]